MLDDNAVERQLPHLDRKHGRKGTKVLFTRGTPDLAPQSHLADALGALVAPSVPVTAVVLTGSTSTHRPPGVTREDFPVWAVDLARRRSAIVRAALVEQGVPESLITVLNAGAEGSGAAARDDSVDVLVATEPLHNTAAHETGHALGNPDENATPSHPKGSRVEGRATACTAATAARPSGAGPPPG